MALFHDNSAKEPKRWHHPTPPYIPAPPDYDGDDWPLPTNELKLSRFSAYLEKRRQAYFEKPVSPKKAKHWAKQYEKLMQKKAKKELKLRTANPCPKGPRPPFIPDLPDNL